MNKVNNEVNNEFTTSGVINSLCKEANETAIARGQNKNGMNPKQFVSAMNQEAWELWCEIFEKDHKSYVVQERATEELADVVITCFSMAGFYGWDLGKAILDKMEVNRKRAEEGK